jgi:hypothetical protein
MWETTDPEGRHVILEPLRWINILHKHPQLDVAPEVILSIVSAPAQRLVGRHPEEALFYGRGAGPTAWIEVVVHYNRESGAVVTAFPRRSFP